MRDYYPYRVRFNGADWVLIWYSNDLDGVVVIDGRLARFDTLESLYDYAHRHDLRVNNAPSSLLDLDALDSWLNQRIKRIVTIEYDLLLDAWNLFSDCAVSLQRSFEPVWANQLYRKVFWATNPPSLTPDGAAFVPRWRPSELTRLRKVLSLGFNLFKHHFVDG